MKLRSMGLGAAIAALGGIAVVTGWGCASNETTPAASAAPVEPRAAAAVDESIVHEKCDASLGKADTVDANGDGLADVTTVSDAKTGKLLCRVADFTHDGKPEFYEYFDADGALRRRELGFEHNESIGSIEEYQGGKLVKRMLDTTGQRRIDTWDTFDVATGKRVKRERDTSNDGRIDQWWTFNEDGTTTVANDANRDGLPDPDGTITIGPNGQILTPDAGVEAGAPSASDAGAPPPPPPPPVLMPDPPADVGGPSDAGADAGKKKAAAGGAKPKGNP